MLFTALEPTVFSPRTYSITRKENKIKCRAPRKGYHVVSVNICVFSFKPAELEAKKKIKVGRKMQTHRSLTFGAGPSRYHSHILRFLSIMQCINVYRPLSSSWTINETKIIANLVVSRSFAQTSIHFRSANND